MAAMMINKTTTGAEAASPYGLGSLRILYSLRGGFSHEPTNGFPAPRSCRSRVAIIDMLGLSQAETGGRATAQEPFRPTAAWLHNARGRAEQAKSFMEIYEDIWRGSYPKVVLDRNIPRDLFYNSYVQTYIQRDVREAINITDSTAFGRFLRAVAARTGQLLNYSDLARDVDIDHKTAKSWLAALETSGLVYLLSTSRSSAPAETTSPGCVYVMAAMNKGGAVQRYF